MRNALTITTSLYSLVAALSISTASAATVTSTADSGAGSLRQAILDASPGETITFAVTGVVELTTGELIVNKDLVILGPGSTNLTIQRSAAVGTPDFRIFNIGAFRVSIASLTIRNGRAQSGGGLNNNGDLLLRDCEIVNNSAIESGGGVANRITLVLSNCVVRANTVTGGATESIGGGIANSGTLTALNSGIISNTVTGTSGNPAFGGGLNNEGTLEMTNCIVLGNLASAGAGAEAGGGGLFNRFESMTLHTTTVDSNFAVGGADAIGGQAEGGGLANDLGTLLIDRSTLSGNVAIGGAGSAGSGGVAQGGGIANINGPITFENSTLSGNLARGGTGTAGNPIAQGSGLFHSLSSAALTHSTITDNEGEGVYNAEGFVSLTNTILAGNAGPFDLFTLLAADVNSGGHNLIGTVNVIIVTGPGDQLNVTAATARLGPLADNGGPTLTHALLCGSPAIDAGDNTGAPPTDQRGFARIVNGTIDIGSYEFQNRAPSISCAPASVLCSPTTGAVATVAVNVSDLDNDSLVVVWALDGSPIQTNLVPANGLPTSARVELVVGLSAGTHTVTATVADQSGCTASCTTTIMVVARGDLYPIALHTNSLRGVPIGGVIADIYNGVQPGNFGWLTWAGSPSEPVLVRSLTPPGNSHTYVNPRDPNDHVVSVGDWVEGKPGVSNSDKVRNALTTLKSIDITVPVWDQTIKSGNNTLYHVVAFARVRIVDYKLPKQNRISARFLGLLPCD